MSIEALNWALDADAGNGNAKLVLLILANRADHKGKCWPGISGMAKQANLKPRTVMRKIAQLRDSGLIEVTHRGGEGEGRKTNIYQLNMGAKCHPDRGGLSDNVTLAKCHPDTSKVTTRQGLSDNVTPKPSINPHRTHNNQPTGGDVVSRLKTVYPKRAGNQPWTRAAEAINARLGEGHTEDEIISGAERYQAFMQATDKIGTPYVMQAATFCGPSKAFLEDWEIPKNKAERKQDKNINAVMEFLDAD